MRISTTATDHERLIRALELKLERLEHGLAMPRDEDAIAQTKALLEEAEIRALTESLNIDVF